MNADSLITVDHFRMDFGKTTVISDLSFAVKKGETFGFLGSNGSGKTTTIRALLGIYQPTGGELLIDGAPYTVDGNVKLGYLPEERGLYKKEPVLDIMMYFGQLKGMSRQQAKEWSLEYLKRVELQDKAHLRLDKLSGGQQQKVQLGITVMDDPSLLILDEPTKGFDPVNRRLLMDIIEEHQDRGATVIFVTHQMEEVERLCDRILLLKDGTSRLYGTIDEVKATFGGQVLEVVADTPVPENPKLYTLKRKEGSVTYLEPISNLHEIQQFLAKSGVTFTRFELKRPSLDDIFISIYGSKETQGENHA
ncbi:ATP-binding cassette domain-containing protein [Streptomyces caniscabiei]|uniref:ABC transporter ATP-binding protein n=1 Tax=Streptomyces caniscabiei TaxID=2746961 RepID=UPI0029BA48A7|nr:ATP-binding cassette domain-containing protein [Streptomyces caniscabiei]MDX2776029.1 ATP-binding cassette domain-containing protein [Streptomyces caniscabiei]